MQRDARYALMTNARNVAKVPHLQGLVLPARYFLPRNRAIFLPTHPRLSILTPPSQTTNFRSLVHYKPLNPPLRHASMCSELILLLPAYGATYTTTAAVAIPPPPPPTLEGDQATVDLLLLAPGSVAAVVETLQGLT